MARAKHHALPQPYLLVFVNVGLQEHVRTVPLQLLNCQLVGHVELVKRACDALEEQYHVRLRNKPDSHQSRAFCRLWCHKPLYHGQVVRFSISDEQVEAESQLALHVRRRAE